MSDNTKLEDYEGLLNENEKVRHILTPDMANFMFGSSKLTIDTLGPTWSENLRKNITYYKKHGSLVNSFLGFGTNKAVIGVGAGPSFNINKDVLLDIYRYNLMFPLDKQPFIIVATNKQFKPLVNMGIYPHFTVIIDAGDALYPQLCEDVPEIAKKSILIAGLHTSNEIIKGWDAQGGEICFFLIGEDDDKIFFEKETGENPDLIHIQEGANVMNTLWIISNSVLNSSVFMAVGNDMAFPYSKSINERRSRFYADGNYQQNIDNKHDDAKDELGWMGFKNLHYSTVMDNQLVYDLEPVGVTKLFWVYKVWMETQVAIWDGKVPFQYYNCSEAGIMGVLCREYKHGDEMLTDKNNWYLMDELCPKTWRTRTLADGAREFLEAKYWLNARQETHTDAGYVIWPGAKTNIAQNIVQNEVRRMTHSGIIL